jgi:hypothetical protein
VDPHIHAEKGPHSIVQVNVRDEVESSPSPVPQDAVSPDDPRFHLFVEFVRAHCVLLMLPLFRSGAEHDAFNEGEDEMWGI